MFERVLANSEHIGSLISQHPADKAPAMFGEPYDLLYGDAHLSLLEDCRVGVPRLTKQPAASIAKQRKTGSGAGKIELVGGDLAIYFEGHIHRKSIPFRLAAPYSFGIFKQPRNV